MISASSCIVKLISMSREKLPQANLTFDLPNPHYLFSGPFFRTTFKVPFEHSSNPLGTLASKQGTREILFARFPTVDPYKLQGFAQKNHLHR